MSRPSARQRGYGTRWEKARAGHLRAHPFCVRCEQQGRKTPATVFHHSSPHKGDQHIFGDRSTWVSSCEACHNGPEQRYETRGYRDDIGADGLPTDPNHPFNRA